jgi:transcriptional antiterminator RfaH
MKTWCVVNTLPSQEVRAETNLRRQGYRAWLPFTLKTRRHARRVDTVRAPLFPGYLFVELDLERDGWASINSTYGVRRLLAQDSRPEVLPAPFVAGLQASVGEGGACQLDQPDDVEPGRQVKILSGPFAHQIAMVEQLVPRQRVLLLIDLLGGKVKMTVPRFAVVAQ